MRGIEPFDQKAGNLGLAHSQPIARKGHRIAPLVILLQPFEPGGHRPGAHHAGLIGGNAHNKRHRQDRRAHEHGLENPHVDHGGNRKCRPHGRPKELEHPEPRGRTITDLGICPHKVGRGDPHHLVDQQHRGDSAKGSRPIACNRPRTHGEQAREQYVIGDSSGSYFAHSYPNLCTGYAHGRTCTFARRVAREMNGEEVKDYTIMNA